MPVESAAEMAEAVKERAPQMALVIMCAAVADYRPKLVVAGKMKKREGDLVLELERTEDILKSLGRMKPDGQLPRRLRRRNRRPAGQCRRKT